MNLSSLGQKFHHPDAGLLVLRLGFGAYIFVAGVMKLLGGEKMFEQVGAAMGLFGLGSGFVFWGLMASLAETLGGLLLILGVAFRPAALVLVGVMAVAMAVMWQGGPPTGSLDEFGKWMGAFAAPGGHFVAFLALLFTGPGKFSLQKGGGGSAPAPKSSK